MGLTMCDSERVAFERRIRNFPEGFCLNIIEPVSTYGNPPKGSRSAIKFICK